MKIIDTSFIYPLLMNIGNPDKLSDNDKCRLEEIERVMNNSDEICIPESVLIEVSNLLFKRIVSKKSISQMKIFLHIKKQLKNLIETRKIKIVDIINDEVIKNWFSDNGEFQVDLNDFAINESEMKTLSFDKDIN